MADILVADDDSAVRELIQLVLESSGHRVRAAGSAMRAMELVQEKEPDLLVLDVLMPGMSGLELCRKLRRGGTLPILMVSALGDALDRVAGLRSGADDYLAKPFNPAELVERVNALLRRARRAHAHPGGAVVHVGDLRLHLIDRQLWVGDRGPAALTPNECRLLYTMLSRPHTIWTREELLRRLWDVPSGYAGATTAVECYVARLRRKLERTPRRPIYLVTVRGRGYQLRPTALR